MNRQGYVLALTIVIITMLSAGLVVFTNRFSVDLQARQAAQLRTQTLWLARSAILADVRGKREVPTPYGMAQVQVERQGAGMRARVDLGGARAEVSSAPPAETYTPAAR